VWIIIKGDEKRLLASEKKFVKTALLKEIQVELKI
jgi:hypothetical protein